MQYSFISYYLDSPLAGGRIFDLFLPENITHTNLRTVIDKSCAVDRRWIFVVNRRAIWSIARGFTAKIGFCKQADCL